MVDSKDPFLYSEADRDACRLLVRLRGILLAYANLFANEEDVHASTAVATELQQWSKSVFAFLELTYGVGMTLLGPPVDHERCRQTAHHKRRGSATDDEVIALLIDAFGEAVYIGRAVGSPTPLADVNCEPLRHEDDGTWWYEELYLGCDDDPNPDCFALASNTALMMLRVHRALVECSSRLRRLGKSDASDVLARFDEWHSSGRWPLLVEELRDAERNEKE